MPPADREFAHINRYWDPKGERWSAKISPGEFYTSAHGEMVSTILGSCVAACVRHPKTGVGGMNHFMLPVPHDYAARDSRIDVGARYGSVAMERLINSILHYGGRRSDLEVKLFGGAKVLDIELAVGERNIEFAIEYARSEGLHLAAMDVGGVSARKVQYNPETGIARVRLITPRNATFVSRERHYARSVNSQPVKGEVTLFDEDQ